MDFLSDLLNRRRAFTSILASIVLVMTTVLAPMPAQAANLRKYAGIVVDAKTGKTLYSYGADSKRYPASVTKVMTLYIVFEELAAGRLKLSSKLTVSKYAASAEPSKLYLKPGTSITVSDAIQALVTKSANDVARVVAENISGSVPKFADRMTKTARGLGMSRTTYKNPSGLPNSAQITTVRDQARLGMAIFQHFPQYFKYFKTRSFRYRGNAYGNHNRLLGNVRGVDGIKTGYTRASGFNLLTSARHGNRHIIVAGFGFDSGGSRNTKVTQLVNKYLPKAHKGSYWKQASIGKPGVARGSASAIAVALKGTPPARPAHLGGGVQIAQAVTPPPVPEPLTVALKPAPAAPAREDEQIEVAAVTEIPTPPSRPEDLLAGTKPQQLGVIAINQQAPAPVRQTLEQANAFTPLDLLGNLINRNGPSTRSAPPTPPQGLIPPGSIDPQTTSAVQTASTQAPKIWAVQIGATRDHDQADKLLASANQKFALLKDYRPTIQTVTRNGQSFYRARFVGFTGEAEAAMACDALKERDIKCLALPG